MKKTSHNILRTSYFVLCTLLSVASASAEVFNWSAHELSFETPDEGWVTYNSNTRFDIRWDEMAVTVQLFTKRQGTKEKDYLPEHLQSVALGYGMYDTSTPKYKVKGFMTFAIDGTMPDGSRAVIACLVSDKKDLIVEVTVNYLYGNRETVDGIIKSFAIGKDRPKKGLKRQKVQKREDAEKQQRDNKDQKPEPEPEKPDGRRIYDA